MKRLSTREGLRGVKTGLPMKPWEKGRDLRINTTSSSPKRAHSGFLYPQRNEIKHTVTRVQVWPPARGEIVAYAGVTK